MSGAYVAKPAVVAPISPTPPPGWDPDWPFDGGESGLPGSGPHPPGYVPIYSLAMTATGKIGYSGAASVVGSLRDHGTYATREPSAITWAAVIDGESVDLRFTDESFASSISSGVSFGSYWGAAPSIEFDLTEDNEGDTITLTGTSTVDGVVVTQAVEITVYELSLAMSSDATLQYDGTLAVEVDLKDGESSKTEEPAGSTLPWTATILGAAVNLRFSGDPGYSSSISSSYSDLIDFWGAEEDIEFELDAGDVGSIVVLQVASTTFGVSLTNTVNITILEPIYSATLTLSWATPSNPTVWGGGLPKTFFNAAAILKTSPGRLYTIAHRYAYYKQISNGGSPVFAWSENLDLDSSVVITSGDNQTVMEMANLSLVSAGNDFDIDIAMKNYNGLCNSTGTAILVIKKNGVTQSTTNLSLEVRKSGPYTPTDNHVPWVTVTAVGGVTVVNP